MNQNFTDMTRTAARHFSGISFNSSLGAALVAVALAGIIVLSGAASVISSAFAGSIKDSQPKEVIDELVVQHDAKMKEFQERFNKRYVFFKPPPPRVVRPVVVEETKPVVVEEPKPTGPPETYPGPSIVWVIGDDVYFNDATPSPTQKYLRVKVGQEMEGVKVINVDNVPRSVRVGHSGGEYDVKVFGDSMQYATLFPATPRASILNPSLIPVPEPAALPSSSSEIEAPPVVAEGASAAADGGRGRLAATPVQEKRGARGRSSAKDEEARRKAEAAGEKPAQAPEEDADAAEDAEADEADDEGEGEGEGDEPKPDEPAVAPGAVAGT